ncbi:hypothetical protein BDN70DRAFT_380860 [Pholiota conissans]|uniref:NACHT domain-containing protein n=1 Tax=Pholiota conissans TaxID=109636 RepID=A0A9P5Z8R5_9AGAR|nr:hypothetical protein BDN70DRAFT_380860 [Pholiota conissans]
MSTHHQSLDIPPTSVSSSSSRLFSNASNIAITGGQFTTVEPNMHGHSSDLQRYGLELLLKNISHGALYDAAERGDPPRCHPGTRTAVLQQIMEWIKAPEHLRKVVIWLYGPAGCGKTSIAQTIAEMFAKEGLLGASFFFGRAIVGRNDLSQFAATLAYQLMQPSPEIKEILLRTIEDDPLIFSRSLEVQMQLLVVEPLKSIQLPVSSPPRVILIDGVDECGPDGEAQTRLLNVLGVAAASLQHIPIIFLITSRPEAPVRFKFNTEPLQDLAQSIILNDYYRPDDDIRLYLKENFANNTFHQQYIKFPSEWPSDDAIEQLVAKSSGQFIVAATVVKFVNSPRHNPVDRLSAILGMTGGGSENPFATLDAMYSIILSEVHDIQRVLQVMTLLILGTNYSDILTTGVISHLLHCNILEVLIDMHSLLLVPPTHDSESVLLIHHLQLCDFLMDQSRSRQYFIDVNKGHTFLCQCWLDVILQLPLPKSPLNLQMCIQQFAFHCEESSNANIANQLETFSLLTASEKIDNPKDLYGDQWGIFFKIAEKHGGPDVLLRFEDELYMFFISRLHAYTPSLQPLIPALFCLPNRQELVVLLIRLDAVEFDGLRSSLLMLYDSHAQEGLEKEDSQYFFHNLFMQRQSSARNSEIDLQKSYEALAKVFIERLWSTLQ